MVRNYLDPQHGSEVEIFLLSKDKAAMPPLFDQTVHPRAEERMMGDATMPPDFPVQEGFHRTEYDAGEGNVTHRWRAQAQMKLERKQRVAVSYIPPRANTCLVRDKM